MEKLSSSAMFVRVGKVNRRDFLLIAGAGFAGSVLAAPVSPRAHWHPVHEKMLVYIGTYTSGGAEGIYVLRFNPRTRALDHLHTVTGVAEPSFLSIDPRQRYLYAVNETNEFRGKPTGAISAFAIDRKTGNLHFINQVPSQGGSPCHVTAAADSKFVLAANYVSGNFSVFPVRADGGLQESASLMQDLGTGPNKERQESAHAHCITFDAGNKFVFGVDLGIDKVMIYRYDGETGMLSPNDPGSLNLKPGAGPRHIAFHKNGRHAYLINELDCTITALGYDPKKGALTEIQTVNTLPTGFSAANTCAEIAIAPSGKFLFGSNRGHDSLVAFAIEEKTGRLTYIEHTSTGGKTPRNFAIDPTGQYLLAANQNSGNIVVFSIDDSGRLHATGSKLEVPAPVCLKIVPDFSV